MAMLKAQVAVTPPPQWVRVVGGFTEHQFAEKRLPTLAEINAVSPDTPVFILHLYDRALLNAAALRAVGYTRDTPDPPGAKIERDGRGEPTGLLIAQPNALILYSTLARGPKLPPDYQKNSTRHFMRELNRLGVTSVIDAGGGFQNYPTTIRSSRSCIAKATSPCASPTTSSPRSPSRNLPTSRPGRRLFGPARRRLPPPQRCWRDARLQCRRLRGLPLAPARHASIMEATSNRWCGCWRRTAGRFGCMRPTTRRSRAPSMCSRRSTPTAAGGPPLVFRPR